MNSKFLILFLLIIFSITGCVDDTYDISNGINTSVTIGGDSLTIPILNKTRITVDTMMTRQQIEMLRQMEDSTYSFNLSDSMSVNMNYLSPVKFSFSPIAISPLSINFSNVKFPSFQFDPVNINTAIQIPDLTFDRKIIKPIVETYTQKFSINGGGSTNSMSQSRMQQSGLYSFGPLGRNLSRTIGESIFFEFPAEIKKIKSVKFANCVVTLTFDKTKTNLLGFNTQNDTIRSFKIDFPEEFKLSTPIGMNSRIDGSSFIIDKAALTTGINVFKATFIIENLDLSKINQNGSFTYDKAINYSLNYVFWGQIDNPFAILGKDVEYTVGLTATPVIEDAVFETNTIQVPQKNGQISFNKTIDNLPAEISEIRTLSFEVGAELRLNISDPVLSPFSLSAGVCKVNLPKSLVFKPTTGLNTNTNILTIPYNELFNPKAIEISGMVLNKTIPDGVNSIFINDNMSYTLSGFTLGATETSLKMIESITDKSVSITGVCSNLVVKDAALTTRGISIDIPRKTCDISVSKYVSADVKKIFSASLKEPVNQIFKINLGNLPSSIDSIYFKNYVIKLPACLQFSKGNVNASNEIVLNEGFKVSNGFSKSISLEGFDFGTDGLMLENGVLSLSESVSMQGKIYVKGAEINTTDLESVEIKPTIQIGEMTLSSVDAEIKPTLKPIVKNMRLNLPAFLMSDSTKLDLQSPVINLEISNSVGIAVNAAVKIIPKRKGVEISDGILNFDIEIDAANSGNASISNYLISKSNDFSSDNYKMIMVANLPDLMKTLPDEMEIIVTPTVIGEHQNIDLSSLNNKIDIKYNVNVPLDFGEKLNIRFNDTISNLKNQLQQLIKLTNKIELIVVVDNTIPINLDLEMIPLDSTGQIISGISVVTNDVLKSCNIDGTAQRSVLLLAISEDADGLLENLDAFKINVSASKPISIAGLPIKTSQYFDIELRIRIPDGITISQDTNGNI